MDNIKVSVICCVFNHERYLKKCLESLTLQKTTFRYEVIVHDDASTDKSADIIREFKKRFPDIIKPIFQSENQYSKGVQIGLIPLKQARGEYIAFCEGDDFWVSENKLQMQVDFLDTHSQYSMCVHAAYYAHEDSSFYKDRFFRPYGCSCEVSTKEVIDGWKFATNSIMYRQSARKDLIIPFRGDCPNGDYALSVYLALNGKVYYMDDFLSAYRVESIGSLNWVWKENSEKYVEARNKYIKMLERIDSYSNYRYTDVVKENIEQAKFSICIVCGNMKEAKKYTDKYAELSVKQKMELKLHYYNPYFFKLYRKMVRKVKNAKNNI